jgi:hypothetical protein
VQIAQAVANNRTPQERARAWLEGVAGEDDAVKEYILQDMWKKEDFPSA